MDWLASTSLDSRLYLVLAALACGYLKLQKALSSTSKIPLGPFLAMAGWAGLLLPHQW
jgi:leader peptidase (prepilin peptidase)/N-methyltransferase